MQPFTVFRSKLAVLARADIDTDQIIPARFLTTTGREGLGRHCFADWRFDGEGRERADFPLNRPHLRDAGILLVGANFGCGSSREHAPWALLDCGIRAVIGTAIADIFRANALKNGLLPIVVAPAEWDRLAAREGEEVEIDLRAQCIRFGVEETIGFEIEPFARRCLLDGVDELGYLLGREAEIAAFEAARTA